MSPSRLTWFPLAAALLLAATAPAARAQFVWTGASAISSNFGDPGNWLGGVAPAGLGADNATFGALSGAMHSTILVPTSGINNMTFLTGGPAFVFTASTGSQVVTFNGNATLQDGTSVIIDASLTTALSAGAHVFDIAGSGSAQINGAIGGTGAILRKSDTGNLVLLGAVSPLGGTIVNGGSLFLNGGSLTQNASNITVGELIGDTATLWVTNGADVSNASGQIGVAAGSTGIVSIQGSGSTWTNSGGLNVGNFGTGLLAVSAGGTVSSSFGTVASEVGGSGAVSVDGTGSLWSVANTLFVGDDGAGTMTITSGGAVSSNFANAGYSATGQGSIVVDGAGSSLSTATQMSIGYSGIGLLNVTNGGSVTTVNGFMGNNSGAVGVAIIDGPGTSWNASSSLTVGFSGTANLLLSNGAAANVNSGSGTLFLGSGSGGSGTLNIGAFASAAAAAGGVLNAATVTTGSGIGVLQFKTTGSSGTPYYFTRDGTVNGAGISITGATQLINTGGFNVLTGSNTYSGPTFVNGGTLVAGSDSAFGLGALTFSGGSGATARFLTAAPVIGGLSASASGTTLSFTQDNSVLTINQSQLTSFNGEFRSTAAGDSLRIVKSGAGTLRFDSGGMYFHNGTINGLRGGLEISLAVNQGKLIVANPFFIEDTTPTIWVNGGTLQLENKTIANPVLVENGGRLAGNGTFSSAITIGSGAILSPGASAGLLTFSNGLTLQTGGALEFEVKSAAGIAGTGFDSSTISGGVLDLSGLGTAGFLINVVSLNASDLPGNVADFLSSNTYLWPIFTSPGGITGFSAGNFAIDSSGFTNSLNSGSFSVLQTGNQVMLRFAAVPEPSTFVLIFLGLAATLIRRRSSRGARLD